MQIKFCFKNKYVEVWPKIKGNKMSKICARLDESGHVSKEKGAIHICSVRTSQGNKEYLKSTP